MPVAPITPEEATKTRIASLPNLVVETWNKAIAKAFDGHSATIYQDDIVNEIMKEMVVDRSDVFNNKWLDIESLYQSHGWNVSYNGISYGDTGKSFFTFTARR